jgi:dTMP kinase
MEKGKLIVIDGIDGSGKKTQTELLRQKLLSLNYSVEKIDFPQYGTKGAGPIEDYLNGKFGSANDVDAYQASVLYAVDRFCASFKIKQWLKEGKIVLCDRYVSANMGHQAGKISDLEKRDEYLEWIENFEYEILKIPRPDINIFLYLNPEISRKLALDVEKVNIDKTKDIHENDSEHMKNASLAYKYVAEKFRWITIDCGLADNKIKSREDIHYLIFEKIKYKI